MTWSEKSRSFLAGATLSKSQRVIPVLNTTTSKLEVVTSVADIKGIGVLERGASSGDVVAVKLFHDTVEAIAGAAITIGAEVGPAASGKYTTAAGTKTAYSLTTATADGDIIEIARFE